MHGQINYPDNEFKKGKKNSIKLVSGQFVEKVTGNFVLIFPFCSILKVHVYSMPY